MTSDELLEELHQFPVREKRLDAPDFFEVVVLSKNLPSFCQILEKFFGPAVKPISKEVDLNWKEWVDRYGGIRRDQTLYAFQTEEAVYLGMIWPWADQTLITFKWIQIPKLNKNGVRDGN